jgi:hypothetical protein
MRNYSVSQIFYEIFFVKEKMWGSLKSQDAAVQLPPNQKKFESFFCSKLKLLLTDTSAAISQTYKCATQLQLNYYTRAKYTKIKTLIFKT